MKKIIFFLSIFLSIFLLLFFAGVVLAQDLEIAYPTVPGAPLSAEPTLPEYIKYLYNFSIILAGLVAFFSLVYGGFRYLTSVGSPAAMADARDQITAGILGLVILLGSYLFLATINPQLAVFRLEAPLPEIVAICGNDRCEPGEYENCPEDCARIELATITYRVYEIPIGQLIESVLELGRLNTIAAIADEISQRSEEVSSKAAELLAEMEECNNCNNASPVPSSCTVDGFCPAVVQCDGGEICDKDVVEQTKEELKSLAGDLATVMEPMLPPLTSLRKDYQRLKLGAEVLEKTIYPINYDGFLETKQIIIELGREVRIIPFMVLGQTIRGRGDAATFYTDEERIIELLGSGSGSGQFPEFPPFDTLATCNECEIDIHFTDFDIPQSTKGELAATYPGIEANCPGGIDCWDYVVQWAKNNNWNPAFMLAMWGEETGFSHDGFCSGQPCSALGVISGCPGGDIVNQLDCFPQIVQNCTGFCEEDNTNFCAFMRCWSGGASCTLSNNPNFWPNLFDLYNRLVPTTGEEETNPAAPSGNCTTTPGALPPELAGCPLEPGIFSFNGGWHAYCRADGYFHDAVDLGAVVGTPVYAVVNGVARGVGSDEDGLGFHVILDTGGFGIFVYAHLTTTSHGDANIPPTGRPVLKGDLIGFVDNTGHSFGDHLHFAYYPNGVIHSSNAWPIECLGIECISVTSAYNWCTEENPQNICQ